MRIAYLGQMADVSHENGIAKKIRGQGLCWIAQGHVVRYFSLAPTTQLWGGFAPLEAELMARGGIGRRILRSRELSRRIRAWQPDVIYFRYAYHSAGLPALFREIPTVAEINTDDLVEYPLTLSRAKVAYNLLTRQRVLSNLKGLVAVTNELGQRFAGLEHPIKIIANGISLDEFADAPAPPPGDTRLIFVGSAGTPWHGLDRIAALAGLFPEIPIDIVGCTSTDWLRATGNATAPPATMRFLGPLTREHYEPVINAASAAIGTMALFRNRMNESSPLKVREYLAFGLPVIGAYRDTDIPEDADYFLRLPNDASPLAPHRDRIATWLATWRGKRVPRAAVAHFDTKLKEDDRLEFMARIVAAHTRQP